ncbi:hypothetical protein DOTSEDRAFT_68862 [Dothistroma septosporum NZE10]|uniref:AAA+ ATPase domain-containing protein n=1 Tax=Dothistroma septosporum (strain NZE10 / CBS 128990) TaxID=675120 RepID=N1Q4C6_DOTSN|nr:hypothetical protein DOTSEDRAFT_68862 [Dothistroma septosporum NZE10]
MTSSALQAAYKSLIQRGRLAADPHQAALVTRLSKLQHDLVETNDATYMSGQLASVPRGLYIYGSVGTGKSRVADLFTSTLPSKITRRRIHFHEFMNDIHQRLHSARSSPAYRGDPLVEIGRNIHAESRVLCFDEFQVTDIADAMILSRLFTSIWQSGGVMVSTSNRHPDGLYENGLNRDLFTPFIKEVQRRCEVWEIGGKDDYRMRSLKDEGPHQTRIETFFNDAESFQESFQQALGTSKLKRVSLQVYGSRTLDVEAAVEDSSTTSAERSKRFAMIDGTFAELCEASLGSADYHALCSSTDTIFITGLRRFREDEKDFVRRFITMIDLAYEMKTRVFCQSDVPLGEVFTNMVPKHLKKKSIRDMRVKGEGGSSSSMMSTFIGETEWSATGLVEASLATGGAGETDVGFAIGRAISRLYEMSSKDYGTSD